MRSVLLAGLTAVLLLPNGGALSAENDPGKRPDLYFDGLSHPKSPAPGPIEKKLHRLHPAANIGLATAGMIATFGTPASIGFAAVVLIHLWGIIPRHPRKKKRA